MVPSVFNLLKWRRLAGTGILLLTSTTGGLGQNSSPQSPPRDAAHQSLFEPSSPKAKTTGEKTAATAVASGLAGVVRGEVQRRNYIDDYIFDRIKRDGIPHSPLSEDHEFARRAYLDATGRIPESSELLAFLADTDANKRDKLVDRLVESKEFVTRWTFYFQDLFTANGKMAFGLNLFNYWIREWLTLDRPYSDVVTDLLTGAGKTSSVSPGALYFARKYIRDKDDPQAPDAQDIVNIGDTIDEFTITYYQVFLGINLGCISCHDGRGHLEKINLFLVGKTREQFFQQASFFGTTRQIMNWEKGFMVNSEFAVDDLGGGYDTRAVSSARVPRNGGSNKPQFLLTGEKPAPDRDPRFELARMLTSDIQFARAFTNRIWAELMGFGIVEPLDGFDLNRYDPKHPPPAPWTLQPSNPELLDAMAKDFVEQKYSFKHFVKTVLKSSAYQLSSRFPGEWKDEYAPYHARKYVRMLGAAELHDAIALATAKPGTFKSGSEKVDMVMEVADLDRGVPDEARSFLTIFGQSSREQLPAKAAPSALQAMLLMQSKVVTERVLAKGGSRIDQLLERREEERLLVDHVYQTELNRRATEAEINAALDRNLVDRIYLATLTRHPEDWEMGLGLRALAAGRKRGAENLQWALINSPEFIFNY